MLALAPRQLALFIAVPPPLPTRRTDDALVFSCNGCKKGHPLAVLLWPPAGRPASLAAAVPGLPWRRRPGANGLPGGPVEPPPVPGVRHVAGRSCQSDANGRMVPVSMPGDGAGHGSTPGAAAGPSADPRAARPPGRGCRGCQGPSPGR